MSQSIMADHADLADLEDRLKLVQLFPEVSEIDKAHQERQKALQERRKARQE